MKNASGQDFVPGQLHKSMRSGGYTAVAAGRYQEGARRGIEMFRFQLTDGPLWGNKLCSFLQLENKTEHEQVKCVYQGVYIEVYQVYIDNAIPERVK